MLAKAACLLAPISIAVQINIGSNLFAAEILIPCIALIIFVSRKEKIIRRELKIIVLLALMYLGAQILSDVWNGSTYQQYSRGWARIFLFTVNLISIYALINNKRTNLLLFALGFALGRICITFAGFEGDAVPWKIGLAKPVTLVVILACLAVPLRKRPKVYGCAVIILGLGMFDIIMDFRSHGAVLIGVAALLLSQLMRRNRTRLRKSKDIRPIAGMSIVGLVAALGAYEFYVYAARSGWLSERATVKFEAQVENTDTPLLVAGRSEFFVYFEAIAASIIVGHGSWPKNAYFADKLADKRYEQGLSNSQARPADDSIPIHSHFFGSWIEAGFLGGLFWAYIVFLISKSVMRSSFGASHMRPLYLYGALLLLWDIFFSPFAGFRRLETAFLIVIVLRSLLQRQGLSIRMKRLKRSSRPGDRRRRFRRRIPGRRTNSERAAASAA